jgi:hypothetical protein
MMRTGGAAVFGVLASECGGAVAGSAAEGGDDVVGVCPAFACCSVAMLSPN